MIDARELANITMFLSPQKLMGWYKKQLLTIKLNCFLLHFWTNNAYLICMIRSIELYCCQLMASDTLHPMVYEL